MRAEGHATQLLLSADLSAPRRARQAVANFDTLDDDTITDAQLIVSELVTNALRHDHMIEHHDVIVLKLDRETNHLRIEVQDRGNFDKRLREDYGNPGLGLRIVDALCDDWQAISGRVTAWLAL